MLSVTGLALKDLEVHITNTKKETTGLVSAMQVFEVVPPLVFSL